jgi:hypothetical protein
MTCGHWVSLYIMLFDKLPFNIDNQNQMLINQLNRKYNLNVRNIEISWTAKHVLYKTIESEVVITSITLYHNHTRRDNQFIKHVIPMFQSNQTNHINT